MMSSQTRQLEKSHCEKWDTECCFNHVSLSNSMALKQTSTSGDFRHRCITQMGDNDEKS